RDAPRPRGDRRHEVEARKIYAVWDIAYVPVCAELSRQTREPARDDDLMQRQRPGPVDLLLRPQPRLVVLDQMELSPLARAVAGDMECGLVSGGEDRVPVRNILFAQIRDERYFHPGTHCEPLPNPTV